MKENNECFVGKTTEVQYERRALEAAFDDVCNPDDWKSPIDSVCRADQQDIVSRAVVFFTATVPTFDPIPGTNKVRVTALGYRRGPAGDH